MMIGNGDVDGDDEDDGSDDHCMLSYKYDL